MIVREEESQDSMPPQDKYSVQSSSTSQRLTSFCLDGGLEDQKQLQFNFHPAGCAVDTFSYCDSQKFQNFAGLQLIDKHHGTTCIRDLSRPDLCRGKFSKKDLRVWRVRIFASPHQTTSTRPNYIYKMASVMALGAGAAVAAFLVSL